MRSSDLEKTIVETAYARWAPIYDAVCGPVMVKGRRAAAEAARSTDGSRAAVARNRCADSVVAKRRQSTRVIDRSLKAFSRQTNSQTSKQASPQASKA